MLFYEGLRAGLLVTQVNENKDLEYIQDITLLSMDRILDV
jgi:hypothetical protein